MSEINTAIVPLLRSALRGLVAREVVFDDDVDVLEAAVIALGHIRPEPANNDGDTIAELIESNADLALVNERIAQSNWNLREQLTELNTLLTAERTKNAEPRFRRRTVPVVPEDACKVRWVGHNPCCHIDGEYTGRHKIAAIKTMRAVAEIGLREAKNAVEFIGSARWYDWDSKVIVLPTAEQAQALVESGAFEYI